MRKLKLILATLTLTLTLSAGTTVTVVRVMPNAIPWLPYIPGFSGQSEVFINTDDPTLKAVRVTLHGADGDQTQTAIVWQGMALAVFVGDLSGAVSIEEIR